jgi:phosphate transport system substrate-binding protein
VLPGWRELLEREGIRLEVACPGTTRGIDALISARGEGLAAASRRATPEELARGQGRLQEHLVGYDAIAILVNVDNDVPRLTLDQLRGLFGGRVTSWAEVGGTGGAVQLLLRPEELGGHEALHQMLGSDLRFAAGAEVVRTNEEVVRRVRADRHAVTFASFTVAGPVRQVPIGKGEEGPFVAPSTTAVRQGVYPLVRPLVFYSWGEPRGAARRFLEVARGPEAQDALLAAGFVPAR